MKDFREKRGLEIVRQAIELDNAGEYEKAYSLYKRAMDHIMVGLKYEKNQSAVNNIKPKLEEYIKRAEYLKVILQERANNAGPNSSGGSGGATATASQAKSSSDRSKEKDDEKSKLRDALSSAIMSEKPNIKWSDVAGLETAKGALKEAVILPVKFPQLFTGKRKPWKGILLYGPPGTGKSYLAKAVATESDSTFFAMSSSDLVSKWQGESERLVRQMFEMARDSKPAIIFIDEIDSLCTSRSEGESESSKRIKTEFLVQMDGVGHGDAQGGVLVLGATNVPWELDPAMRRRFEKRVYISLPEAPARTSMFKLNLGDTPNTITNEQFEEMGRLSEGYSGSDISVVVKEALMEPLRKCQYAKQFKPVSVNTTTTTPTTGNNNNSIGSNSNTNSTTMLLPCSDYPNCPHCPMALSTTPESELSIPCQHCHAIRMSLYDVPTEQLLVPEIEYEDFEKALRRGHSSVATGELDKFIRWTEEFGEEG
eukprot:gene7923-16214_t